MSKIPKVIHQYWTGGPIPDQYAEYSDAWAKMNPGWRSYLWTDSALEAGCDGLVNDSLWKSAAEIVPASRVHQFRADLVRYELLWRMGGIWIDMDFEPLKPLNSWIREIEPGRAFAVWEVRDRWAANGLMGAPAEHWFIDCLIRRLPEFAVERRGEKPTRVSGPQFMTEVHREQGEPMQILDPDRFYPYLWSDLGKPKSRPPWPPECVAVHHWNNKRRSRARRGRK